MWAALAVAWTAFLQVRCGGTFAGDDVILLQAWANATGSADAGPAVLLLPSHEDIARGFRLRLGNQSLPPHVIEALDLAAIAGNRITIITDETPGNRDASGHPVMRQLRGFNMSLLNSSAWSQGNGSLVPIMAERHPIELIPLSEIKQGISAAIEEGIRKAERTAQANKTKASVEDIKRAVNEEVLRGWQTVQRTMRVNRFRRRGVPVSQPGGVLHFFRSVAVVDWLLLVVFIMVFTGQSVYNLNWPGTRRYHGFTLLGWVILAGVYNLLVVQRMGSAGGILWLNGYIFELVFLVENVLVCHIIVQAFKMPKWVNEKVLVVVVFVRIAFQMVFYMGLAQLAFSGQTLPYILGLWLLFVAFQSAMQEPVGFDIMDSRVVYFAKGAIGDRLSLAKDESGAFFVCKADKTSISLTGLMVLCLVFVDFLLHVDVALTKIQELEGNAFLCFSSAVAASFSMPELLFVTRALFRRFPGLKYGMSFILVYISMQMLLHAIWWPPVSMDLVVWLGVLIVSAAIPGAPEGLGWPSTKREGVDAAAQATSAGDVMSLDPDEDVAGACERLQAERQPEN